ncbi:ecto-ADP-ribosyltransferase 5-like [Alosa alosa]|uniref:ecto-ADP-ribosyltransferase 5-like n=1 Tax=Alosa alosa TaxID=278164 RepID=UPI0020151161|nr:ecto-ADP-ribosyltransferase 5-like [Alosa alosa]
MSQITKSLIRADDVLLLQDERQAVEGQALPLDMAVDSVDDQYQGCRDNMAELVKTEFLPRELQNTTVFGKAWRNIETKNNLYYCDNDVLSRNHCIALYVYTDNDVYADFNQADRKGKHNYTTGTYEWYSLQFYLTEAVQILTGKQNNCKITYRGTNLTFDKRNVLDKVVRFGSFASSSFVLDEAQKFGTKSCFNITTCYGAAMQNYSKYSYEEEVLIPPYEKFIVTDVLEKTKYPDLWCDTVYVLNSTGTRSDLNCAVATIPTTTTTVSGQSLPLHLADQSLWVASLCVIALFQTVMQ